MTAHKHAEMIKAKADNMDLVLFSMSTGSDYGKWSECKRETMPKDNENIKYFLCLPQHKEACLHWLNGGEIECDNIKNWIAYDLTIDNPKYPLQDFTGLEFNFRIKPRKEKRWVVVHDNGAVIHRTFESRSEAESFTHKPLTGKFQFIEIEIEVEV